MTGKWTEEDDRKLWSLKSKQTTEQLAATFGRNANAIRYRLRHLKDPSHKAYKRRVGISTAAASTGSSKSIKGMVDLTNGRNATPFAAKYIAAKQKKPSSTSSVSLHPPKEEPRSRIDPSSLNDDQKAASEYIFSGGNAFLTGAAGVGKSYLLNYLIQGLRDKYPEPASGRAVSMPMSKGRGRSSSKLADEPAVVVAAATGVAATHIQGVTIHSWAGVRLGVGGARVLVPRVLQNEAACRRWRKAKVLVLDEVSMIDGMLFEALDQIGREVRGCRSKPFGGIQLVLSGDFFQLPPVSLARCGFAFESPAWSNAGVKMVELRKVVRQSGDQTFINMLNQIRIGLCPAEITEALEACNISRKALPIDGIVPTKLYCTNKNVDEENNRNLRALPGKEVLFAATDMFKGNYTQRVQKTLTETMDKKVQSELLLKIDAQVILSRNMPEHNLVNGSRGIVKSFGKSSSDNSKLYPVIHFSNGVKMTVTEESVFQGGASGAMTRSQLPLKLAWSLTVHKSQGMTIERAELQLDDAFETGQVYVALSRVTSLEGLWVRGGRITQNVVKAHPKVKAFYQRNGSTLYNDGQSMVGTASTTTTTYSSAGEVAYAPYAAPTTTATITTKSATSYAAYDPVVTPKAAYAASTTTKSTSTTTTSDDSDLYAEIFGV